MKKGASIVVMIMDVLTEKVCEYRLLLCNTFDFDTDFAGSYSFLPGYVSSCLSNLLNTRESAHVL